MLLLTCPLHQWEEQIYIMASPHYLGYKSCCLKARVPKIWPMVWIQPVEPCHLAHRAPHGSQNSVAWEQMTWAPVSYSIFNSLYQHKEKLLKLKISASNNILKKSTLMCINDVQIKIIMINFTIHFPASIVLLVKALIYYLPQRWADD